MALIDQLKEEQKLAMKAKDKLESQKPNPDNYPTVRAIEQASYKLRQRW